MLKDMKVKVRCTCACHRQNGIVHFRPCCNNGYIEEEIQNPKDFEKITTSKEKKECNHEYSDGTGTGYHVCKKCGDMY